MEWGFYKTTFLARWCLCSVKNPKPHQEMICIDVLQSPQTFFRVTRSGHYSIFLSGTMQVVPSRNRSGQREDWSLGREEVSFLILTRIITLRWFFFFKFWNSQPTMKKKKKTKNIQNRHQSKTSSSCLQNTKLGARGKKKPNSNQNTKLCCLIIQQEFLVYSQILPHLTRNILNPLLTFPPSFKSRDQTLYAALPNPRTPKKNPPHHPKSLWRRPNGVLPFPKNHFFPPNPKDLPLEKEERLMWVQQGVGKASATPLAGVWA